MCGMLYRYNAECVFCVAAVAPAEAVTAVTAKAYASAYCRTINLQTRCRILAPAEAVTAVTAKGYASAYCRAINLQTRCRILLNPMQDIIKPNAEYYNYVLPTIFFADSTSSTLCSKLAMHIFHTLNNSVASISF